MQDIFYHLHDGPYFTGTLLKAKVLRTPSDEFNLFKVSLGLAVAYPNAN